MSILDTPWSVGAAAAAMKNAGATTVIRYINFRNSTKLPEKRIEAAERAAIKAAGLTLALVFEQRNGLPQDFTTATGTAAAVRAFAWARDTVGRPSGRPIYFAVDNDVRDEAFFTAIETYFQAVNAKLQNLAAGAIATPVGVYGCGEVCSRLKAKNLATYFWLAGATDWNGTKPFLGTNAWHLFQADHESKVAGIDVDANQPNPALPDFGAFTPTL